MVLVASMRSRAALRLRIFSAWRWSSSASVSGLACHQSASCLPSRSAASRAWAWFARGRQRFRSCASSSRSASSRSAAGLAFGHELPHIVVRYVGVEHRVEVVVLDGAGGGGEGEEVIHRRRDLEGALVAVAHDPLDPLGVGYAGVDHAAELVGERANARVVGHGVVVVVERGRAAGVDRHRRRQAALELVVVVAVEQIVLAVVLVLHHRLDRAEPLLEEPVLGRAAFAGAVGPAAPGDVGLGEIARVLPAALVDQRLQTRAVSAGLRAEDPVGGEAPRAGLRRTLLRERRGIGGDLGGERVVLRVLVEGRDRADG